MKSTAENAMETLLKIAGYPYVREFRFHPTRLWRADFHIPPLKTLIEIDGVKYGRQGGRHQTGRGMEIDIEKRNAAIVLGYVCFHFTPSMVYGKCKINNRYIPSAIDTLDEWVMGTDAFEAADRSKAGYILPFMPTDGRLYRKVPESKLHVTLK